MNAALFSLAYWLTESLLCASAILFGVVLKGLV